MRRSMESPDRYVDLLASLCASAQVIGASCVCRWLGLSKQS